VKSLYKYPLKMRKSVMNKMNLMMIHSGLMISSKRQKKNNFRFNANP